MFQENKEVLFVKDSQIICRVIEQIPEGELIFASRLYARKFRNRVTESAYYKTMERLHNAGSLCKLAKGIYYRPAVGKYGIIPPSQQEIISAFTEQERGTVVGYSLYNNLKLTTQVPKTITVLTSNLDQQTKSIRNVRLLFCDLTYTPQVRGTIHMMEVLQNFSQLQDLNFHQFIGFCEKFAAVYDGEVFEQVYRQLKYQKRTVAFLQNILNYYHVANDLDKHLSSLSKYKHPTMEEIYEASSLS